MARLEDSRSKGLPESPAPPRRGANPWKLSGTARNPEQGPAPASQDPLVEWIKKGPAEGAHTEAREPPQAASASARSGFMPLIVMGLVVVFVMRVFFQARGGGDWMRLIGPLLLIAFIVHGWWRVRQRRETKKTTLG